MSRIKHIAERLTRSAYLHHPANAGVKALNAMEPFFHLLDPFSQQKMLDLATIVEYCLWEFQQASPQEMIATLAANMAEHYNGVDPNFLKMSEDKWEEYRKTISNPMAVPFEMYPKDFVEFYVQLAKEAYDAAIQYGMLNKEKIDLDINKISL